MKDQGQKQATNTHKKTRQVPVEKVATCGQMQNGCSRMTFMPDIIPWPMTLRTGVHHLFRTPLITLVLSSECQNNKINSTRRTINVGSFTKDQLPQGKVAENVLVQGTSTLALKCMSTLNNYVTSKQSCFAQQGTETHTKARCVGIFSGLIFHPLDIFLYCNTRYVTLR